MDSAPKEANPLVDEHHALMRQYGRAQARCSELVERQSAELQALRAQAMRLRAAVIVRETALCWEREERRALEASMPGLLRRAVLARRIDLLVERVQELLRERLHWQWGRPLVAPPPPRSAGCGGDAAMESAAAVPMPPLVPIDASGHAVEDVAGFEASLVAADLVICQTGCLSHDAYWRVQDHCKRTGKACVVVARPEAVRIIRIHRPDAATAAAAADAPRSSAMASDAKAPAVACDASGATTGR